MHGVYKPLIQGIYPLIQYIFSLYVYSSVIRLTPLCKILPFIACDEGIV